jgi:signal transduction histidine kinase
MGNDYLENLLDNLLENAVEHNTRREKFVWINMKADASGYWISIADNGPGIPENQRDALFDMTTRYGGIGLHQSKHIVEKLGGKIAIHERVEGDHTQGAIVEVFLPSVITETGPFT